VAKVNMCSRMEGYSGGFEALQRNAPYSHSDARTDDLEIDALLSSPYPMPLITKI
jgi:hypothetical protein